MTVLSGYISNATGGSKRLGMAMMARALMRGDPEAFKVGYTADNALIAVVEQAGREGIVVTRGDVSALADALGADVETVKNALAREGWS